MVGDLYFHQQKECPKRMDKRLYPRASPLSRALREIAKGKKLSSLQVPILEDAASHIEELEDQVKEKDEVILNQVRNLGDLRRQLDEKK